MIEPLFVLSAPRCFTSIVASLIGGHTKAYSFPELNLLCEPTLRKLLSSYKDIYSSQLHGLLRTVAELYSGEQTIESIAMAHRWIQRNIDTDTGQVYRALLEKVSPLMAVDKSPAYSSSLERLRRIEKAFPNAHYLHLTRHPSDMSKSMLSLDFGHIMAALSGSVDTNGTEEVIDPQFMWYEFNMRISRFLSDIPKARHMRIKGENFLNDTESSLEQICHWLGWDWDLQELEGVLHPERSPYASFGPVGAELGNDPNFLRSPYYRPRVIKIGSIHKPLTWIQEGRYLLPHVKSLAKSYGYT